MNGSDSHDFLSQQRWSCIRCIHYSLRFFCQLSFFFLFQQWGTYCQERFVRRANRMSEWNLVCDVLMIYYYYCCASVMAALLVYEFPPLGLFTFSTMVSKIIIIMSVLKRNIVKNFVKQKSFQVSVYCIYIMDIINNFSGNLHIKARGACSTY